VSLSSHEARRAAQVCRHQQRHDLTQALEAPKTVSASRQHELALNRLSQSVRRLAATGAALASLSGVGGGQ